MMNRFVLPPFPFSEKAKLLVGVSGGSDSMGLLLSLFEQLPNASQRLIVVHINYGLRGRESNGDAEFVRGFCRQRHLSVRFLKVSRFKNKIKLQKRSLQDLAREIRYVFFQKLALKEKAWGIAVAHHLEDQSETILDRFLRGSGARGLSGLRPVQALSLIPGIPALKIWRPLLHYSKNQIQSYLKTRGINWREDASNQSQDYRRNRLRHEVIPFLSRLNSRLPEVLARMGEVTSEEDRFMDELTRSVEKRLKSRWKSEQFKGDAVYFKLIPLALKRRWVRYATERLNEKARGLSFERIEEVIRVWEGKETGPRDMGFGLSADKKGQDLFLRYQNEKKPVKRKIS